ncbi:MAG: RDD family protein [Isosphaeraceae bacterium]
MNPYAPPISELEPVVITAGPESLYSGYAPFGRRLGAFMLDNLIFAILSWLAMAVLFVGITMVLGDLDDLEGAGGVVLILLTYGGQLIGYVAYYSGMESSSLQATPGKLAMGLRVTDLYGRRIGFGQALGRLAAKIPSALVFYIGFLMAAFTEKHQALHDMMARTLVVKLR